MGNIRINTYFQEPIIVSTNEKIVESDSSKKEEPRSKLSNDIREIETKINEGQRNNMKEEVHETGKVLKALTEPRPIEDLMTFSEVESIFVGSTRGSTVPQPGCALTFVKVKVQWASFR